MEHKPVIDETFVGLVRPAQTFELGRPDITDERPGAALVAVVQEFERADGFKKIAEARDAERLEGEKIDASVVRSKPSNTDAVIIRKDSERNDLKND